jgi:hypothetical protein
MGTRACTGAGARARALAEAATAAIAVLAWAARSTEAAAITAITAITKTTAVATVAAVAKAATVTEPAVAAITAIAAKAATVTAEPAAVTAEAAASRWGGRRAFELEFGGHGLPTVLGDIEGHPLAFAEGLGPCCRDSGDMDKHIRSTAIRQDEAKALGLVEPLNRSRLSHRNPSVLAQINPGTVGRFDAIDDFC